MCWFVTVREPELNGLLRACIMATLMPGSEYPVVATKTSLTMANSSTYLG